MAGRLALIIGYGNTLRGDDGVGRVVAEALAEEAIDGTEVISCHQLTPELAACLTAVDVAVFVDADGRATPGDVVVTEIRAEPSQASVLVHDVDPGLLLAMASKLYGRAPPGYMVAVGAESFELGSALSPPVAAAVPKVVAAIRGIVSGQGGGRSDATSCHCEEAKPTKQSP